jgi:hypothetical protein
MPTVWLNSLLFFRVREALLSPDSGLLHKICRAVSAVAMKPP